MEYAAIGTRALYACASIATQHRAVRVNRSKPTPMRAPHEGPGLFALESAMDELAYELRLDPLDLRLRNYAEVDPTRGVPFSKKLRECYVEGARRFGWTAAIPRRGQRGSGESSSAWAWPARSCRRFAMPRRLGSRSIGRARCGSRAARRRSAPVSPRSCPRSRRMCLACRSSACSLSWGHGLAASPDDGGVDIDVEHRLGRPGRCDQVEGEAVRAGAGPSRSGRTATCWQTTISRSCRPTGPGRRKPGPTPLVNSRTGRCTATAPSSPRFGSTRR